MERVQGFSKVPHPYTPRKEDRTLITAAATQRPAFFPRLSWIDVFYERCVIATRLCGIIPGACSSRNHTHADVSKRLVREEDVLTHDRTAQRKEVTFLLFFPNLKERVL